MDIQLIFALIVGIATIVVVVLATRLDAFAALVIAGLVTGLIAGQDVLAITKSITSGFGSTMGSIGIVIGLGVIIGKFLEVSGAADALARSFLRAFGKGKEEWAMGAVGCLVSIPVFCDSGYVIMNPLARSIARVKRGGYIALALALGCGMTLTHHLIPPTPGPLAAAGILQADLGMVIVVGICFTVLLLPVVVLYAKWIGPKIEDEIIPEVREAIWGLPGVAQVAAAKDARKEAKASGENLDDIKTYDPVEYFGDAAKGQKEHRVGAFLGSLPLAVPLILILANTVATAVDKAQQGDPALGSAGHAEYLPSAWATPLIFLGHPVVALMLGLIVAVYVIMPRWTPKKLVAKWFNESAASAGLILLITGAGGGFGQVLRDSGVGDALAEAIASTPLPAFLVPFVIASVVRVAQGSGTVAMITGASVAAPIVAASGLNPVVAVLACTTGSMLFSYFNDSYFWVVTRFSGLEGTAALKGWSGITTAAWAGSIPLLLITSLIL